MIRFRELRPSSFGNEPPATRYRTMKMKYFLAALLVVSSLGTPATVQAGTRESSTLPPQTSRFAGREVAAPPSSAAGRIVTWYASYGSGRNARKQHSAPADVQVRGPRGRGAAFERCLHDRPRPQPMRRANVSLWKSRLARARAFVVASRKTLLRIETSRRCDFASFGRGCDSASRALFICVS